MLYHIGNNRWVNLADQVKIATTNKPKPSKDGYDWYRMFLSNYDHNFLETIGLEKENR